MRRRNTYIEGLSHPLPHPFRTQAENLARQSDTDTFKEDGVIRWKSNGNVPPQEVLDFWKHIGKRFNMSKSVVARNREQKAFLEELHEMRNAFGEGATVVNVITGRWTKL